MPLNARQLWMLILVIAGCAMILNSVVQAQSVTLILREDKNQSVTGELLSPIRDDHYRIRVEDRIIEIKHSDVYTTIPVGQNSAAPEPPVKSRSGVDFKGIIVEIAQRKSSQISPQSQKIMQNCFAYVSSSRWDSAIRDCERLARRSPKWADPQILRALLHSERGEWNKALRVGRQLEAKFSDDRLALKVAAECYRRGGYGHRYALVMEGLIDSEFKGAQGLYQRVALWWPISQERAQEFWDDYLITDPDLLRPWCVEGHAVRSLQMALVRGDWQSAMSVYDETRQLYPWMKDKLRPQLVHILELRVDRGRTGGMPEEALTALETLEMVAPERMSEWVSESQSIRTEFLRRGLAMGNVERLQDWCTQFGHLFTADESAQEQLAVNYQKLGLRSLQDGRLQEAQMAFLAARDWDETAREADLGRRMEDVYESFREDIRMRRSLRLLHNAELLRDAFPELQTELHAKLADMYREELTHQAELADLQQSLRELRAVFNKPMVIVETAAANAELGQLSTEMKTTERLRDGAAAYPILSRYFPHEVGTRWVYRLASGGLEQREIRSVTPLADGSTKIVIRVLAEGDGQQGFDLEMFLVGNDLMFLFADTPQGEVALRYPLSSGSSWSWEKGALAFSRKVTRPSEPLHMSLGTFDDYVVIEGANTIRASEDHTFSTWKRVTYVGEIGIVKIEGEDPTMERTLVEFHAPAQAVPLAKPSSLLDSNK